MRINLFIGWILNISQFVVCQYFK